MTRRERELLRNLFKVMLKGIISKRIILAKDYPGLGYC